MEGIATGTDITTKKLKRKEGKSHESCGQVLKTECEWSVNVEFRKGFTVDNCID